MVIIENCSQTIWSRCYFSTFTQKNSNERISDRFSELEGIYLSRRNKKIEIISMQHKAQPNQNNRSRNSGGVDNFVIFSELEELRNNHHKQVTALRVEEKSYFKNMDAGSKRLATLISSSLDATKLLIVKSTDKQTFRTVYIEKSLDSVLRVSKFSRSFN
jgi:hypothetical protein